MNSQHVLKEHHLQPAGTEQMILQCWQLARLELPRSTDGLLASQSKQPTEDEQLPKCCRSWQQVRVGLINTLLNKLCPVVMTMGALAGLPADNRRKLLY